MSVRTKEQLAVLVKLIEVNNLSLTRRNLSVRQKIWHVITKKLNQMPGAKKDIDGWKRCYNSWRMNANSDFNKEVAKLLKDVDDDDYFNINVSEDEFESENDIEVDYDQFRLGSPSSNQKIRLHELVSKHNEILNSNADDQPLKAQIWFNISEELNAIPNATLKLSPDMWKKRVDWDRCKVRKNQKAKKRPASPKTKKLKVKRFNSFVPEQHEEISNIKFEILDNSTMNSLEGNSCEQEYGSENEFIAEELENRCSSSVDQNSKSQVNYSFDEYLSEDINALLNDTHDDDDSEAANIDNFKHGTDDEDVNNTEIEFKPQPSKKHIKPTPIAESFKYSQRVVNAIERLGTDVSDMKELLKKTTQTLVCLENVVQQQCHKQDETNALLKRNGQLLKMLVFQSNRGTSAANSKH